jgi:putative sigma-54 modulation protein
MKIEFTGRQTEVPDSVRRLAQRKLEKLARLLPGITRAHVTVTADKHRRIVEVSVHSKKVELEAEGRSNDPELSVADAMDKLLRQAQRYVGKRREAKRGGSARIPATAPEARGAKADRVPRVVRSRRFPAKPMTLDEAAIEVWNRDEGFLVFRDARTERVSVLYRRKDGNLGLIEPEA